MRDSKKLGWLLAGVYATASLVAIFGWAVFAITLLLLAVVGAVVLGVQNSTRDPRKEARHPSKTCPVEAGQRCPLCHANFEVAEVVESCAGCSTLYHRGCREEWRVCSTLGCSKKRRTIRSQGELFRVAAGVRVRTRKKSSARLKIRIDPAKLPPAQAPKPRVVPRSVPMSFPLETSSEVSPSPDSERLSRANHQVLRRRTAS